MQSVCVLFFGLAIILLGSSILGSQAWCLPWQGGGTINVCKSVDKELCIGVASSNTCINLIGGPFVSGFSSESTGCHIFREKTCEGDVQHVDKTGFDKFPWQPLSLRCPCLWIKMFKWKFPVFQLPHVPDLLNLVASPSPPPPSSCPPHPSQPWFVESAVCGQRNKLNNKYVLNSRSWTPTAASINFCNYRSSLSLINSYQRITRHALNPKHKHFVMIHKLIAVDNL